MNLNIPFKEESSQEMVVMRLVDELSNPEARILLTEIIVTDDILDMVLVRLVERIKKKGR